MRAQVCILRSFLLVKAASKAALNGFADSRNLTPRSAKATMTQGKLQEALLTAQYDRAIASFGAWRTISGRQERSRLRG